MEAWTPSHIILLIGDQLVDPPATLSVFDLGYKAGLRLQAAGGYEWNQEDDMASSFPGFHENGGFPDDKDPLVVALLIGGKDKETLPMRCIPIGRAVHHFPIEEGNLYLQAVDAIKALHGEVVETTMVLISLEGFNEKDRLQLGIGHLDDFFRTLAFGNMEDLLAGVKVVGISLYHSSISKPNNDLILYLRHVSLRSSIGVQRTFFARNPATSLVCKACARMS